jgi:hypothetical protein
MIVPKRQKKRALTNLQMHQGALANSSKSFYQNIKRFFKKFFIFSKKSCQVFRQLFSPVLRNILPLIPDYNRKKRRFSSKIHFICKILPKIFAGSKKSRTFASLLKQETSGV